MTRPYSEDSASFDAEATAALSLAFEQVCARLDIPDDAAHDREVIAVRIIELARAGLMQAAALRDRVLSEAWSSGEMEPRAPPHGHRSSQAFPRML
jgi:hypothetical protein